MEKLLTIECAKIRCTLEGKLADDIYDLNRTIREILECSSDGIVEAEAALAMRDHIRTKIDHLNEMINALRKADLICLPPVTGPMARRTHGPAVQLTDEEKALIAEAYKKYYSY